MATALNDSDLRILIPNINFLELIGTGGDGSKNFSQDYLCAFDNVLMITANQPTMITDQEIYRLYSAHSGEVCFEASYHTPKDCVHFL